MTLADLGAVLVLLIYVALGWWTGTVRRVLGLVIIFVALVVATFMGQQGADILMQYSASISVPDARFISWTFFLLLMIVVFEGAATAIHAQLQLAVVAVNKGVGVVLGVVTGVALITALVHMYAGFGTVPTKKSDQLQITVREAIANSALALPLAKSTANVVLPFLTGALPRDPQTYFGIQTSG